MECIGAKERRVAYASGCTDYAPCCGIGTERAARVVFGVTKARGAIPTPITLVGFRQIITSSEHTVDATTGAGARPTIGRKPRKSIWRSAATRPEVGVHGQRPDRYAGYEKERGGMPAKSKAQVRFLHARFGHAWAKRHHFAPKGKAFSKLPKKKGKQSAKSTRRKRTRR
jgi:hypothetical protein